jgi:hypothetical protein
MARWLCLLQKRPGSATRGRRVGTIRVPHRSLLRGWRMCFGSMTPDPKNQEEYRDWAAECLRLAQAEADLAMRLRFLTMAQRWLDLAEGNGAEAPLAEPTIK